MAKELFYSPRYDKKGVIGQDEIFGFSMLTSFTVTIIMGVYVTEKFDLNAITPFLASALGMFIVIIVFIIGKFKYRQYKKILEDQKDLFHSNGKTPYVAPHEFGMSVSDTNYSLYLDLTLRLLSIIMKADKEEKVLEMDVVKAFIKKMNTSNFKKTLDKFNGYLKEDKRKIKKMHKQIFQNIEEKHTINKRIANNHK